MACHHRRDPALSFRVIISMSTSVSQPPRRLSIRRRATPTARISAAAVIRDPCRPRRYRSCQCPWSPRWRARAGRGAAGASCICRARAIDVASGVGRAQLRLCRARVVRRRIWSDLHPVPGLTVNLARHDMRGVAEAEQPRRHPIRRPTVHRGVDHDVVSSVASPGARRRSAGRALVGVGVRFI